MVNASHFSIVLFITVTHVRIGYSSIIQFRIPGMMPCSEERLFIMSVY